MQTQTDYDKQAQDFLARWGIDFTVKRGADKCPPFCDGKHIHGDQYRVTLTRPLTQNRITFPFWNSKRDSEQGNAPTAYDVLACIGSDLTCPETFSEFCAEYGESQDSRKAHSTWKRCAAFGKKLRAFFDCEEMQAELQTIN